MATLRSHLPDRGGELGRRAGGGDFCPDEAIAACAWGLRLGAPLLRVPVVVNEANGLGYDSCLMVDKITTVRMIDTRNVLGWLEASTRAESERRLVFLGFGA